MEGHGPNTHGGGMKGAEELREAFEELLSERYEHDMELIESLIGVIDNVSKRMPKVIEYIANNRNGGPRIIEIEETIDRENIAHGYAAPWATIEAIHYVEDYKIYGGVSFSDDKPYKRAVSPVVGFYITLYLPDGIKNFSSGSRKARECIDMEYRFGRIGNDLFEAFKQLVTEHGLEDDVRRDGYEPKFWWNVGIREGIYGRRRAKLRMGREPTYPLKVEIEMEMRAWLRNEK